MPTIELHHEDQRADRGEVVGTVRILDERLVTVTTALLCAGLGVPVELAPGRYFADGWSPVGERFYGVIETADGQAVVHTDRFKSTEDGPTGWLRMWKFTGRAWAPGSPPLTSPRSFGSRDSGGSAVTWHRHGEAAKVFVVPENSSLTVTGSGVTLLPGLAATLLGYLHRGDRSSAGVVAEHAVGLGYGTDFATDIATAYYLVCTDHQDAGRWVSGLGWSYPDSVDLMLLQAHLSLRDGDSVARDELHRAATSGLPFVAEGLRLLSADLAAAGADPLVRPYVLAQLDSPLTSFWGNEPGVPLREANPCDGAPPAGSVTWPIAPPPQPGSTPARQIVAAARSWLEDTLQVLQDDGAGLWPAERQVVRGDLGLKVVVAHSKQQPDRYDLEVAAQWSDRLTGLWLGVRDAGAVRLAEFDDRDICAVRDLRPGRWAFTLCERRLDTLLTASAVPLPVVQSAAQVLAAAGDHADEVLRATMPSQTTVVLRRDRDSEFFLEATRPSGLDLLAIGVEYGNTRGTTALRVMPYPANEWGRRGTRIDFDDFDLAGRWQVDEELTPDDLARIPADDLVPSLTAELTPDVRDTWREIATRLPAGHRDLIERLVA